MSLRSVIWKSIDRVLASLGYELRSRVPGGNPLTMQAALERAAARDLDVRTVVDIGAARGRWTRKALPLFPGAHFLLIEPLEEHRGELKALRREEARVDFLIAAAGDAVSEVALTVTPDLDGSGVYDPNHPNARKVPLTTLDTALGERGLPGPYLLKFDTHGFEMPILAGAAATLRETALVVMEVHNFQLTAHSLRFHEICAHLDSLGFRCADMADVSLRPKDKLLWQADFFFLPKTSPLFAYPGYR